MQLTLTIRDGDDNSRDVRVSAQAPVDFGTVADQLHAAVAGRHGRTGEPLAAWSGGRHLAADAVLGGPDLREGAIVRFGAPRDRTPVDAAVLRLHVSGGPDAGAIIPLARGTVTIGRAAGSDVLLGDPNVSRAHATVTVSATRVAVTDLDPTHVTLVNGVPITAAGATVQPGDLIRMGETTLRLAAADEPAAAVRPGPPGRRLLNRSPRVAATAAEREVVFPTRHHAGARQRVQWLAALLPAAAGVILALAMHAVAFLAFAVLSPLMLLGSAAGDRVHWRRARRLEAVGYRAREATAAARLTDLLRVEIAERHRAHPDPAAAARSATIPDCRLWERSAGDADVLATRLGTAAVPARTQIRREGSVESARTLDDVPTWIDLRLGPLGLAGPAPITAGIARWVVGQLAVLHSPAVLDLVFILSASSSAGWSWARWLPHVGTPAACTDERQQDLVADLLVVVETRAATPIGGRAEWRGPWTVVVVDRSGDLAATPGLSRLLAIGPQLGVTAVCIDEHERRLPSGCVSIARVSGETGSRLTVRRLGQPVQHDVIADRVDRGWAERIARSLAPLIDAGDEQARRVPDDCRLVDLLGIADLSPETLTARWRASDGRPTTLLGAGAEGPMEVDLVRDGPHALVAGTTGAGKSELLQTMVAGLAAGLPPDAITFLLIDYKGGAAFADCADLPHTVGVVTDLDRHLTQRALYCLDAELRSREGRFAAASVTDLEAYRRTADHSRTPLGRLVLVVDEFAALNDELPDFVRGLVSIAQRGRSLGVHLVLATQRPGGVVSPEIRANTSLRVALRVTDPGESNDVVGSPAASTVDKRRPGRAFVRTGTVLTEVQTARIGGRPTGRVRGTVVTPLDEWGHEPSVAPTGQVERTDLQQLVAAACEAAQREGITPAAAPWLPPLRTLLPMHTLAQPPSAAQIAVGLADLPAQQRQIPVVIDLNVGGPLLVAGGARSGRTTTARALALAACARLDADELHLHVIDCASGGLRALAGLPHCGSLAGREDFSTVARLVDRIAGEVGRRQALFDDPAGSTDDNDRTGQPRLLVILDGWEGFVAASDEFDAGRTVDTVIRLLREIGSAAGTILVTGDRGSLTGRVSGVIGRRYLLPMADRADYTLAGIPIRSVPDRLTAGRALDAGTAVEVQFAFAGDSPAPADQARAVADVIGATSPPRRTQPMLVRTLPHRLRLSDLPRPADARIVLGSGGDSAGLVCFDPRAGAARLLVAGPSRSGRTTALHSILVQATEKRLAIAVAATRGTSLTDAARRAGVDIWHAQDDVSRRDLGRCDLVLVDDCESFLDTAVGNLLAAVAREGRPDLAIVASGRPDELAVTYRGIAHEVRRARTGVLLQPGPGDGDLLGVRLPRANGIRLPGRGIAVGLPGLPQDEGVAVAIQLAQP